MKTPIALIIFNRPDHTESVFEAIRQAQPPKLLVIADGPRPDRPDDIEQCAATRAIIDRVDWDCEVLKNFSDVNLGCGIRPATGISWVFDHVEEAIILEDDCIPHPSFFSYCDELLERYRHDERVMHISGNNFWSNKHQLEDSYTFSRYTLSWGWATWRRAWMHYDRDMKHWPEIKQKNLLKRILNDQDAAHNWTKIFQNVVDVNSDVWDYQWTLTCWLQSGLAIIPNVNLVSNVGFGANATHTFSDDSACEDCPSFSVPASAIGIPLTHPSFVLRNVIVDEFLQENLYEYYPPFLKRIRLKRIKQKIYRLLKKRENYKLSWATNLAE
jgi:hypothetical protein